MSKAIWHFPRTDLAKQVFGLLAKGPIQAVSLFGPRRTGKTQFLLNDLAPLAESEGHRVVYASLWQTLDTPLGILLYEFDRALREGSFLRRLKSAAGDLSPKFTLKAPFGAGEVEVDLSDLKGKAPESHLLLLDQYCERLASDDKPALLLFDEFQELPRSKGAEALIAALRTSLDKRRDKLSAVFTGSSQVGLRKMFTARQAPFFRFAQPIDLPKLDDRFVDHQLAALRETSKTRVARDTALAMFAQCQRNPMMFQRWLTTLALNPNLSPEAAMEAVSNDMADEFGFATLWVGLTPTQRLVARLLAERVSQLYGQSGGARLAKLTAETPPTPSAVQSALMSLTRKGVADRSDEVWTLADPLFEQWVRDRPDSDF